MEQKLKKVLKALKINESLISSVMGGVVVVVMMVMIFNYFKSVNKTGTISEESAAKVTEETEVSEDLPTTYKVKKGDDLWHIAEKFYNSGYNYVDIIKENKLGENGEISEGMELRLPKVEKKVVNSPKVEVKAVEVVTPTVVKVETKPVVVTTKNSIEGKSYKTVRGDFLWSIAVRAYGDGYAWVKIYNANKKLIGRNPSVLYIGLELTLPR